MAIRDKAVDAAQDAQQPDPSERAETELERALDETPESDAQTTLHARMDKHEAQLAKLQEQYDAMKRDLLATQGEAEARADAADEAEAEAQQLPAANLDQDFVERAAAAVGVLPNQVFDVKREQDGRVRVITTDARKLLSKGAVK